MPNVELAGKARLSAFRHISLGTWRTAYDPSIYGSLAVRMDQTMQYVEAYRRATGRHLTVTHLMAKIVGTVLVRMPELNAILRWGRIYRRQDIAVFFQVALKNPETGKLDLSGIKIDRPHEKNLEQIIGEFEAKTQKVRSSRGNELEKSRGRLQLLPGFMVHHVLRLLSFLSYTLNLDLRFAGIPKDPFGSVMVTNIGSMGLEGAYAPLVPFSRVPLLVAMGSVQDEPVVEEGEIVSGKVMRLFATFDHRVLDGAHAARMVEIVRAHFERPYEHFDPIPEAAAEAPSCDSPT